MRDKVGRVLQRRVSGNGKDPGDRLCVPTHRMQRQNALEDVRGLGGGNDPRV